VLDEVHAEAQSLYDQLMDFYSDDRAQSVEIRYVYVYVYVYVDGLIDR